MKYFDDVGGEISLVEYETRSSAGVHFKNIQGDLHQFTAAEEIQLQSDISESDSIGLSKAILNKEKELDSAYESAVRNGFQSSALGVPHTYKSHSEAQTDLIGLKACNRPRKVWCSADGGATWGLVLHSSFEIEQVLNDGADVKELAFTNLIAKKTEIAAIKSDTASTDVEKIYAITSISW